MQVPENAAGKTVRCPSCNQPFAIPTATPVAPLPVNRSSVAAGANARAPQRRRADPLPRLRFRAS